MNWFSRLFNLGEQDSMNHRQETFDLMVEQRKARKKTLKELHMAQQQQRIFELASEMEWWDGAMPAKRKKQNDPKHHTP